MKPDEARARRRSVIQQRAALGEQLADYKGDRTAIVPDLIPKPKDLDVALKAVRRQANQTERTPRGPRRNKKLDELMLLVGRLVFIERVLALDPLERAGLTPARLFELSRMAPSTIVDRVKLLNGQEPPKPDSGLVLP